MDYKLGKQAADYRPTDLKLMHYAVGLPALPHKPYGYGTIFGGGKGWGMLGNDGAGDCVFAGGGHETMLYNRLAGHPAEFTAEGALADYAAVTGYDPRTGEHDDGTVVQDAYGYRRRTGLVDANGVRHKIDAYVRISAQDWDMLQRCVWAFGAVGIGFNFPSSAWAQYDAGQVWDYTGDTNIEGGHYVCVVGSQDPSNECSTITWGRKQRMHRRFYERYCDEAWVPLSKEALRGSGYNVRHIDWSLLQDDLQAVAA
jgi:hypothetical protein